MAVECWVDQNPGLGGTIPTEMGLVASLRKSTESFFMEGNNKANHNSYFWLCFESSESWSITRCGFTGPIPSELGNLRDMGKFLRHKRNALCKYY